MQNQKFPTSISLIAALLLILSACITSTTEKNTKTVPQPISGRQFPAIKLISPADKAVQNYLGLENINSTTFAASEINCDALLIEIFSMYCPFCQHEAPAVNTLYKLIQNNKKLSRRIKMIGIGAGNSAFEVGIFKNRYGIKFPLFSDSDLKIHQQLGQVKTPFFIIVSQQKKSKDQILLTRLGSFDSPQKFLEIISAQIDPTAGEKK